jgi:ADP-heptose:LPS heptosyltransferase
VNKIIISPYSRKMRNGTKNPKDYPNWDKLVVLLKASGYYVTQVGAPGEARIDGVDEFVVGLPLRELRILLEECDTFISVDNFFQHFAWYFNKPGVVIFGQSDPLIFGHDRHTNILKDRSFLRPKQFDIWEASSFNGDAFVEPQVIFEHIVSMLKS